MTLWKHGLSVGCFIHYVAKPPSIIPERLPENLSWRHQDNISVSGGKSYQNRIHLLSTGNGIHKPNIQYPELPRSLKEQGASYGELYLGISNRKIDKKRFSKSLKSGGYLHSDQGRQLMGDQKSMYHYSNAFYARLLNDNKIFKKRFPGKAKIPSMDITCISESAGTFLINQNQKMQQEIDAIFESVKNDLLSSKVIKNMQSEGIRRELYFVSRLIQRARNSFLSCFMYRVKVSYDLFSTSSEFKVFSSCEAALESGIKFMKVFWNDIMLTYKLALQDSKHTDMISKDTKKGIMTSQITESKTFDNQYYVDFLDSLAFYRYQRMFFTASWIVLATWLKENAPDWYALDSEDAKIPGIPDISPPLKERLNNMVRENVESFDRPNCVFRFMKGQYVQWSTRSPANVVEFG